MNKDKGKAKELNFTAENLAVPEVHVEGNKVEDFRDDIEERTAEEEVFYDNLAIPEVHPKWLLKKKESKLKK